MIIVEGPDCSGKSTLIEKLSAVIPFSRSIHYDRFDHDDMFFRAAKEGSTYNGILIADRFNVSAYPYDMYLRSISPPTGYEYIRMIDRALLANEAITIKCLPPKDIVMGNWERRKDEELVKKETTMSKIYDWYRKWTPITQHIVYDFTSMSLKELNKQIKQMSKLTPRFPIKDGYGAGSPEDGRILLIADRCNDEDQHEVPFVNLRNRGCSGWLAKILEINGYPEYLFHWINVYKTNGESNAHKVFDYVSEAKPSLIVAMGAEATCIANHFKKRHEVYNVYHPQYWKRFQIKKGPYPLIDLLGSHVAELL